MDKGGYFEPKRSTIEEDLKGGRHFIVKKVSLTGHPTGNSSSDRNHGDEETYPMETLESIPPREANSAGRPSTGDIDGHPQQFPAVAETSNMGTPNNRKLGSVAHGDEGTIPFRKRLTLEGATRETQPDVTNFKETVFDAGVIRLEKELNQTNDFLEVRWIFGFGRRPKGWKQTPRPQNHDVHRAAQATFLKQIICREKGQGVSKPSTFWRWNIMQRDLNSESSVQQLKWFKDCSGSTKTMNVSIFRFQRNRKIPKRMC
jgi:hypothetical protein